MNDFYPISFSNQNKIKEGHNMFDAQLVAKLWGWKVFPANPENKTPLIKEWQHKASNDETIINHLFAPFPNAMVAVPTGPVNGITVIDFDIRDSYNGVSNFIQEGFKIPKTAGAKTPSGGFHLYFDSGNESLPNSVSKLAIGVDVRGDGGYVIAPPSQSIKGTYKWETDWFDPKRGMAKLPIMIKNLILFEKKFLNKKPLFDKNHFGAVAQEIDKPISEGSRNNELTRRCGYLFRKYSSDKVLEIMRHINQRCCNPPIEDRELYRIVCSIGKREGR
mgnify:FL=1|jgi:hypothetical protein|tara:strand:+ start:51 stop:878 length:828 start_codon:yes stop_codon:yes gene_type:complete